MKSDSTPYVPFSQRNGLKPIPPQLKLGEVSDDLRRLIDFHISRELERHSRYVPNAGMFINDKFRRVGEDLFVRYFGVPYAKFTSKTEEIKLIVRRFIQTETYGDLFDLVEFFLRHPGCSDGLKGDLVRAFVEARAAYRVFDRLIVAIGTEESAEAIERAIRDAEAKNATAARGHLIAAGVALRNGDWPGSVRESIHAVESIAIQMVPDAKTLGDALKGLETRRNLHPALKEAFSKLYGYSSDEKGVRHALVFGDKANVDESDALFMLGACASFTTYLIARAA